MSVKLELYRVFKEVAEVGNITAAAQALYISQSAVSQSIKQLERDLQTRLFARNSRGVTLTAEGQMLYEYVRSAMGLLETGEEKLSQTRELQMGQLTIGASDTVTSHFLLLYDPEKLCLVFLGGDWEVTEKIAENMTIVQTEIPTPEPSRNYIYVGAYG